MKKTLDKLNYTFAKDINFLRAIAVLSVILFHSGFYSNGYLGVDIFFVISGYVITKVLTRDFAKNEFSLTKFYIRRIKRLYPALLVMVATSYLIYLFFGIINISDFNEISKTAITGLFGLSNIYFLFRDQNYFIDDGNNFFLHLWSLGIEEQYYFIYPIFLFLVLRNFKSIKSIIVIFLFMLIFLFLIKNTDHKLFNNFFSPLFRFNELFLGCFAFFVKSKIKLNLKYLNITFILILLLSVFTNILNFELQTEINIICFITFVILISEDRNNNFFSKIIKSKPAFLIGDISYSMYLWHLPIVYFAHMFFINTFAVLIIVLLGSIIFGFFSRKYLEIPIIKCNFNMRLNNKLVITCIFFFLILFIGNIKNIYFLLNTAIDKTFILSKKINIYYNYSYDNKLNSRLKPNYAINDNILDDHCFLDRNNFILLNNNLRKQCTKISDKDKKKIFIVYGDCHALHFAPMVNSSKFVKNISFIGDISLSTLSQECLIKDKCSKKLSKKRKLYYNENIKTINELSKEYQEVIIISKFLMSDKVNQNIKYEKNLKKFINDINKNIKIIFIKQTPTFKNNLNSCFAKDKFCYGQKNLMLKEYKNINKIINNIALMHDNVNILDLNEYICPKNKCTYFDIKKNFIFFRDNDNISNEFSKYLSKFFEKEMSKLIN